MRHAQQGDAAAFERIHHQVHTRHVCIRMVGNLTEAEDLTQEAFLLVFRKIQTFRGESPFSTWLHRLALNVVLMHLRKKKLPGVPLGKMTRREEESAGPCNEVFGLDLTLTGLVYRVNLERAVEHLPEAHKIVFVLHVAQITILILVVAFSVTGVDLAGRLKTPLTSAKTFFVNFFEWFGNLSIFCGRLARAAFAPPFEFREFARQLDELGSKSLPLVAFAGAATGVVLSLETRDSLLRFGAKSLLPAVIVFSIIKESGPIITALVVSGRVAAGIGAELGAGHANARRNGRSGTCRRQLGRSVFSVRHSCRCLARAVDPRAFPVRGRDDNSSDGTRNQNK